MTSYRKDSYLKILFVTFGDDTHHLQGLDLAAKRLEAQAISSSLFTLVLRFDYSSVQSLPNFGLIKTMFARDIWGFGYFVWKPFIVNWVMDTYGDLYDYVVYADAGCEIQINRTKKRRFHSILSKLDSQPILAHFTELPETLVTKRGVLDSLNCDSDKFRGNLEAGVLYLKTGVVAKAFVNEWLTRCVSDNFAALMPDYDESSGQQIFESHRFDQSVFSVLYKNNFDLFLIPVRPRVTKDGKLNLFDEIIHSQNSIWPIRNRTGISNLNQSLNNNVLSLLAFPLLVIFRAARRKKHKINSKYGSHTFSKELIPYKEHGWFATR